MPSPTPNTNFDLFISYARADRAWVEGYLLNALTESGLRILTEADFALGVPRLEAFQQAVTQSRRTLLVLSPAYMADDLSQFVNILAQTYGIDTQTWPLIPLVLQTTPNLPPRLAMLQPLNATDPADRQEVIERLVQELGKTPTAPPQPPPCPYPGLAAFTEADHNRFYGRNREIQEMVERLRFDPFLAVIGPSGTGKSSLVAAGLIPALRTTPFFGTRPVTAITVRPSATPESVLAPALTPYFDPTSLARRPGFTDRFVLIVDQFEELFSLGGSGQIPFQSRLLALADQPDCQVILTVRADFYPDLMASPLWPRIQARRFEVVPLDETGIREVIEKPAARAGVWVDPLLVERIIADSAGEPGSLPLIQETLTLLWAQVERRYLASHAYDALTLGQRNGDSNGLARSGLHVAIARRADQVLAGLSGAEQASARRILLGLVHFGQGRADTRRRQTLAELQEREEDGRLFNRVLDYLTGHRLIMRGSGEAEEPTVDLAHEALIRHWPRLRTWIDEFREAELMRRRLEDQAIGWQSAGPDEGLLLRGGPLAEAESWLAGDDARVLGVSAKVMALVRTSREAMDAAMAAKESARQRELALERGSRRRAYALAGVFGLIAAISLGYFLRIEFYRWQARSAGVLAPIPGLTVKLETNEVSNLRWSYCVNAGICEPPPAQISTYFEAGKEDFPITGVDALQSARFCAWIGRRLPAADEWQAAATNGGQTVWPWGNQPPPDLQRVMMGQDDLLTTSAATGSHPAGANLGTTPIHDLLGNVWEWTSTPWDNGPQTSKDWTYQTKTIAPNRLTVAGASFVETLTYLRSEISTNDKIIHFVVSYTPDYRQTSIGLRCGAD